LLDRGRGRVDDHALGDLRGAGRHQVGEPEDLRLARLFVEDPLAVLVLARRADAAEAHATGADRRHVLLAAEVGHVVTGGEHRVDGAGAGRQLEFYVVYLDLHACHQSLFWYLGTLWSARCSYSSRNHLRLACTGMTQ